MSDEIKVSLTNMGRGVALEKFNDELAKVIANIMDPNTDFKKKRKIMLNVEFSCNETRDIIHASISSDCKLAGYKPAELVIAAGIDRNGVVHASEVSMDQRSLGELAANGGKITAINGAK